MQAHTQALAHLVVPCAAELLATRQQQASLLHQRSLESGTSVSAAALQRSISDLCTLQQQVQQQQQQQQVPQLGLGTSGSINWQEHQRHAQLHQMDLNQQLLLAQQMRHSQQQQQQHLEQQKVLLQQQLQAQQQRQQQQQQRQQQQQGQQQSLQPQQVWMVR
jgi:hypothetical protein